MERLFGRSPEVATTAEVVSAAEPPKLYYGDVLSTSDGDLLWVDSGRVRDGDPAYLKVVVGDDSQPYLRYDDPTLRREGLLRVALHPNVGFYEPYRAGDEVSFCGILPPPSEVTERPFRRGA